MKAAIVLFFLVASSGAICQTRTETTVKLKWEEQTFFHFYTSEYHVYVSKLEFLNLDNELLSGLFIEFAQSNDSMNLKNPFSTFKPNQQTILWNQLIKCTTNGHLLIQPINEEKKLKSVVILDDKSFPAIGEIWECRDSKTKKIIFSHSVASTGSPSF
ncbi:hypothetical protein [Fluviicola taffensis]|uniref:Uncharacterized protein n=1 Tax=Fluviicola taffensis (strain DSM 16823 / NCIMB 13979 / RW262) TaxID=755732 RepID=F2ID83_FLUTR|nr:hypothetical protein [Fluviicola taffensis]AEA45498.1 hypothetical protein Fluta_3529 [Fluviicola taffensis DSM 16823]